MSLTITPENLYMPYPATSPHPAAATVETESLNWASDYNLASPATSSAYRRQRLGRLVAYIGPQLSTPALRLTSDLVMWLYCLDDKFDQDQDANGVLTTAAALVASSLTSESDLPDHNPFALAFNDLGKRVSEQAVVGGNQLCELDRWLAAVRSYLLGVAVECHNRGRGVPTIDDYIPIRRLTSGAGVVFSALAPFSGYNLPPQHWADPAIGRITRLAEMILAIDNDYLSYLRELKALRCVTKMHNIVAILQVNRALSEKDALGHTVSLRNEWMGQFEQSCTQAITVSAEADMYVQGLQLWLSGHIAFCKGSSRYSS